MSAVMNDWESLQPDSTGSKQIAGRFIPGKSGNPKGRPKGSRNQFAEDFVADFHNAWSEHGQNALLIMAAEKPSEFVQAAVKILPRMVEVNDPVGELDRELTASLLDYVRSRTAGIRAATGEASGVIEGSVTASGLLPVPQATGLP